MQIDGSKLIDDLLEYNADFKGTEAEEQLVKEVSKVVIDLIYQQLEGLK